MKDKMKGTMKGMKRGLALCLACGFAAAQAAGAWNPARLPKLNPAHAGQIDGLIGNRLAARPAKQRNLLVFYRCEGWCHGESIVTGNEALRIAAGKTGAFRVEFSDQYESFRPENLKRFDAVVLQNTTDLDVGGSANVYAVPALIDFVRGGKGLAVIHSGADNFKKSPEAAHMVGGLFWGHPWHAGHSWAFRVEDPSNPVNASFGGKNFRAVEEVYMQQSPYYDRSKLHVLVSLDFNDPATRNARGQRRKDNDYAVSWIRPYGKGRVFYTTFGHDHRAWCDKAVLAHMLAGIQYALGDLKADDTPGVPAYRAPGPGDAFTGPALGALRGSGSQAEVYAKLLGAFRGLAGPAERGRAAAAAAGLLTDPGASKACKIGVLRALYAAGAPAEALGGVKACLKDPETRSTALTILAGALSVKELEALWGAADAGLRCSLLSALAARGASGAIAAHCGDADPDVAAAAYLALGRVGDEAALARLAAGRPAAAAKAAVRDAWGVGFAAALGRAAEAGRARAALPEAEKVFAEAGLPAALRAAAARVMIAADERAFGKVMKDPCAFVRRAAVRHAAGVGGDVLAAALRDARGDDRAAILGRIAENRAAGAAGACAALLASPDERIVCAALDALGAVGSKDDIPAILPLLGRGGAVGRAAKDALSNMKAPGVGEALFRLARKDPGLIPVLTGRAEGRLFREWAPLVKAESAAVRREAWKAAARCAAPPDAPLLFDWLKDAGQAEANLAQAAVLAAARNMDEKARTECLETVWSKTAGAPAARAVAAGLMAAFPDDRFLPLLQAALSGGTGPEREAVIETLGGWKTMGPRDALLRAYAAEADAGMRRNFARAALRLVAANGGERKGALYAETFRALADEDRARAALVIYNDLRLDTFALLQGLFEDPACGAAAKKSYIALYDRHLKGARPAAAAGPDKRGKRGKQKNAAAKTDEREEKRIRDIARTAESVR